MCIINLNKGHFIYKNNCIIYIKYKNKTCPTHSEKKFIYDIFIYDIYYTRYTIGGGVYIYLFFDIYNYI